MISLRQNRPLLKKFSEALQAFPLKPGDKIVVGVSGGADSVCLLHLLRALSDRRRHPLHVVHLNHRFRPEAVKEADFVKALAESWGIPATISSLPVPQICKERRLSKQAGARAVRYDFFETVAREVGARWIAVGHTADDQAETFLMRLVRGAGPEGLCAIPPMREGKIIRPLLTITRREILAALSEAEIPFMEDPSNRETIYFRNDIRHRLLPLLEEYNPRIKDALSKAARLLREENDFLTQLVEERISTFGIAAENDTVRIDLESLRSLHPALRRRVLRRGIDRLVPSREIGFDQIEKILSKALSAPAGKEWTLPRLRIEKGDSELILQKTSGRPARREPTPSPRDATFAPASGLLDLPDWGLRLTASVAPRKGIPSFSACVASFDFDRICLPLTLRGRRAGDVFVPAGMGGKHKKLQDFFTDAKIPKSKRSAIPILSCSGGILWVVGLRVDERFRATRETKTVLTVRIRPIGSAIQPPGPPFQFQEER